MSRHVQNYAESMIPCGCRVYIANFSSTSEVRKIIFISIYSAIDLTFYNQFFRMHGSSPSRNIRSKRFHLCFWYYVLAKLLHSFNEDFRYSPNPIVDIWHHGPMLMRYGRNYNTVHPVSMPPFSLMHACLVSCMLSCPYYI